IRASTGEPPRRCCCARGTSSRRYCRPAQPEALRRALFLRRRHPPHAPAFGVDLVVVRNDLARALGDRRLAGDPVRTGTALLAVLARLVLILERVAHGGILRGPCIASGRDDGNRGEGSADLEQATACELRVVSHRASFPFGSGP